jgi:pSer/pThr/pTyr-binding forkhead associated (FHA) protein/tRNA A-37 threonylcarbamoyl transferase component Bud32
MSNEVEPAEGTRVGGRYLILRELGRGGSKRVYLAEDTLSGIQVAVALLAPEYTRDPVVAARFAREARAASALRSPFIVRVYDVGKRSDESRYLVLEAVLGRGLDEAMNGDPVEPAQAARWSLEVLAALCEAHARGVIHRDVKPENILLARTPAGEVAKLTDFGLAKVVDASLDGSLHLRTAANAVLGTPEYMSPEQWRGRPVDARTDIYAMGVLLYEMLTGTAPFAGAELPAIYAGHLFEAPPAFDRALPAMALALEPLVRRALSKEPEDRFDGALAMARAVAEVTGIRVPEEAFALAVPRWSARTLRAELACDLLDGPVTVLSSASVILGRDPGSHVRVHCVGPRDVSEWERTISRAHASIEWRGGAAFLADLGSSMGTTVDGAPVGRGAVALRSGATIALGPHVLFTFAHAPSERGALPAWATLRRTDRAGGGHVALLLLGGEAELSSREGAALRWPSALHATLSLRDGSLVWREGGEERTLEDGVTVTLDDGATLSVAIDG